MKRLNIKRILSIILFVFVLFITSCSNNTNSIYTINKVINRIDGEYSNKTVILHTNDVHGAITNYSKLYTLKQDFESKGATVILADAGDFSEGSIYVNYSNGQNAINIMNSLGYDVSTFGNHDFQYGLDVLDDNVKSAHFKIVLSNVYKNNQLMYKNEVIIKVGDLSIGFFGLLTPETRTKVNPNNVKDITIHEKEELYEDINTCINDLKDCDLTICLSHLGADLESGYNSSNYVMSHIDGIDFMIDGHSHSTFSKGTNNELMAQTGTGLVNVGVIVIDNKTESIEDNYLYDLSNIELTNNKIKRLVDPIISSVDITYKEKIAETKVYLEGTKAKVRSEETNLGDLITDSFYGYLKYKETTFDVPDEDIVVIHNGGGIRASAEIGNITRETINKILPFDSTLAIVYVKGYELLEALEASTYNTPTLVGGFPHIARMNITIDTTKSFDQGVQYPNSTYYAPNSINRVTINDINGLPFDENKTYCVISNNFITSGGDTYYAFKRAFDAGNGFDTSIKYDYVLVEYIINVLNGVIGLEYLNPQGRITIIK